MNSFCSYKIFPIGACGSAHRHFWIGTGALVTYKLFDMGLASFLVMETLHHGTAPIGYLKINLRGGDPRYGGQNTPSRWKTKDLFFVSYRDPRDDFFNKDPWQLSALIVARCYAICASVVPVIRAMGYSVDQDIAPRLILPMAASCVIGLSTPLLKFRFTDESLAELSLEPDPNHHERIQKCTSKVVRASHLGITGSILYGIDKNLSCRMRENQFAVLSGMVCMAVACLIGKKTYQFWKAPVRKELTLPLNASYAQRFSYGVLRTSKKCAWSAAALGVFCL